MDLEREIPAPDRVHDRVAVGALEATVQRRLLLTVRRSPPIVPGVRAAGVACGIKPDAPDLALIVSDEPAHVAGVFTRSTVVGAPVELCRERVRGGRARAIVANSGCSNVAMGRRGLRDAQAMAAAAARAVGADEREVLVASTGVIGEPLPMARVRAGIRDAAPSGGDPPAPARRSRPGACRMRPARS